MKLVLTDSGVRVAPAVAPVADGERVGHDYINMTVPDEIAKPVSDWQCVEWAHRQILEWLQVSGVSYELEDLGRRHLGWQKSARVGDVALVAAGGNGNTIFISLSGHGCLIAGVAGIRRIAEFCMAHDEVKITRIDLAFDDVDGSLFRIRDVDAEWRAGLYSSPAATQLPKLETRGDAARGDPAGRGLTKYIGSRRSGNLKRLYEKGRQLGDPESPWLRVEAELHSSCFVLPPDMLVHPTQYFVALCPAFERVRLACAEGELQRMARLGLADAEKAIQVLRHQYGAVIHALRNSWFDSDDELLRAITREGRISPALRCALQVREVALDRAAVNQ
jgi:DNA relaxase NicK